MFKSGVWYCMIKICVTGFVLKDYGRFVAHHFFKFNLIARGK